MEYIQVNHLQHHPLRPENIIFTENIGNLKLIDVGFDQRPSLTPKDTSEDIYNYGMVVKLVLDQSDIEDAELRRVSNKCLDPDPRRRYNSVHELRMALANRSDVRFYLLVIAFLSLMVILLVWLSIHNLK